MRCLILGHLTRDIIIKDNMTQEKIGGGAYYSALALSKFCDVVIVTKIGKDFPKEWIEKLEDRGINVIYGFSNNTTTYELRYVDENTRSLRLLKRADELSFEELPSDKFDIILVNPVAGEISTKMLQSLKKHYLAVDLQGFVRDFDEEVHLKQINGEFLRGVKILHADKNEVQCLGNSKNALNLLKNSVEIALISNGKEEGVALYKGSFYRFVPLDMKIKEATGAGDTFLASFSYFYKKYAFEEALKMANAFTAIFLSLRNYDFSIREVMKKAKLVEVKKISSDEEINVLLR